MHLLGARIGPGFNCNQVACEARLMRRGGAANPFGMKLYAFYCRDGEHGAVFREHTHEALLEHFAEHGGDFAVAGPLAKGEEIVGSLLIIKAKDEAEARARLEAIPYFSAGVWQSIRADEFRPLFGDWARD